MSESSTPKAKTEVILPWSVLESAALRPLAVLCHGLTDQGKVRQNNQDHFLIAELSRSLQVKQTSLPQPGMPASEQRGHVFIVADGMGGHQGGEIASEVAVVSIENFLLNTLKQFLNLEGVDEQTVLKEFRSALVRADAKLFEEATSDPGLSGMGTTLTMAFVYKSRLFIAHAGDSRCYLFSQGMLQQVTHDHTIVAEMVRRGALTPEEAARSSARHVVTNALGGNKKGVQAEVHRLDLQAGDVLLLCSDGLTGMVPDERIRAILQEEADPKKACSRLVAAANQEGGKDNITVIVARFSECQPTA